MRKIINFVVLFLILTLGNMVAPQHVLSTDWKVTLIATVVCTIAMYLAGLIAGAVTVVSAWHSFENIKVMQFIVTIVFAVIISFVMPAIGLLICDRCITGFAINGFGTYFLLTAIINLLNVGDKKERD